MPYISYNEVTGILQGCSGKMGNEVYYQRNGKTFKRKAPAGYNKVPTEKQSRRRTLFTLAHRFGQNVIADPVLKAFYEAKAANGQSAYSLAVSKYLTERL